MATNHEFGRWQGQTDEVNRGQNARLDDHSKRLNSHDDELETMRVDIAILKTKIALWAALGAIVGGGIVSFVVTVALR